MAVEIKGAEVLVKAEAAASTVGKVGYAGKFDTNGKIVLAGAGDAQFVILEGVAIGQTATVQILGGTKVVAGGAFKTGDFLSSDANGRLIKTTTTVKAIAMALGESTASGQIVPACIIQAAVTATA